MKHYYKTKMRIKLFGTYIFPDLLFRSHQKIIVEQRKR